MDLSQALECNRARDKWKSQARLSRVGSGASENTLSSAVLKCHSKGSVPGLQQGYHAAKQEGKEQSMGLSTFKPSLRHSLWEMEEWKLRHSIDYQNLPPIFMKRYGWSPNSMFDGPWSKAWLTKEETYKFTGLNLRKCHYTFFSISM